MDKRLIEVLPKVTQYKSILYTKSFNCPHCDKSGFFDSYGKEKERPILIGWCETDIGYMGVFECPCCFEKYRFHCTIGTLNADIDEFDMYLYYKARQCKNWEDVKHRMNKI